jgi:hypothetical protein
VAKKKNFYFEYFKLEFKIAETFGFLLKVFQPEFTIA